MVAPILEELSGELEDKLVIAKLDVDNNKRFCYKTKGNEHSYVNSI